MATLKKFALTEFILSISIIAFLTSGIVAMILTQNDDKENVFPIVLIVIGAVSCWAAMIVGIVYTVKVSKSKQGGIHLGTSIVGICSIIPYAAFGLLVCSLVALAKKE